MGSTNLINLLINGSWVMNFLPHRLTHKKSTFVVFVLLPYSCRESTFPWRPKPYASRRSTNNRQKVIRTYSVKSRALLGSAARTPTPEKGNVITIETHYGSNPFPGGGWTRASSTYRKRNGESYWRCNSGFSFLGLLVSRYPSPTEVQWIGLLFFLILRGM